MTFKRIEMAAALALLVAILGLFAWLAVPAIFTGPSRADDAWYALAAKALADGRGYGYPVSSELFKPFGVYLGAGPPLIMPGAIAIAIFGPEEWLPGAVALALFVAQLAIGAALLVRRLGFPATVAFMASFLVLAMLASTRQWYFGAFIGEPVTVGFLFIGIVILSMRPTNHSLVAAGISLSLAFLTKTIALFPLLAILGMWLLLELRARAGFARTARCALVLAVSVAIAPLAFELVKLMTLGMDDYWRLIETTRVFWSQQGQGEISVADRISEIHRLLGQNYLPGAALLLAGTVGSLAMLRSPTSDVAASGIASRIFWLAAAGAAAALGYFAAFSILWPRYAWIGTALVCLAAAVPALQIGRKLRLGWTIGLIGLVAGMAFHGSLVGLHERLANSTSRQERAATVALLQSRAGIPYAAEWWANIYDVVYSMEDEGTWEIGNGVSRFAGQEFIALINHRFTNPNSRFAEAVEANCLALAEGRRYLTPHQCGAAFWNAYATTPP